MNRNELIHEVAKQTGIEQYRAESIINQYENLIIEHLKNGEDIHLHGFISFYNKQHTDKVFVHPKSGELRKVKAHNKLKVKVSDKLDRAVNGIAE